MTDDDIEGPHPDDHVTIAVRSHLDAVKELLGWSRKFGVRFENAEVTDAGIQLTGIVDDFPRSRLFKEPAPAEEDVDGDQSSDPYDGKRPKGLR